MESFPMAETSTAKSPEFESCKYDFNFIMKKIGLDETYLGL